MESGFTVMDKAYVEENLDMRTCIQTMEKVLCQIERGECVQSLRTVVGLPGGNVMGFMPAYLADGFFGAKILSVYPANSQEGYPSHQGQVLLFEMEHGQVVASVDANAVTKIRTGAVSAVASKYLANADSRVLAILGTGEQAESHFEAMLEVFPLERVKIWGRTGEKAKKLAETYRSKYKVAIEACQNVQEAVADADIVCTVTSSKTPILQCAWLKKGAHVNLVGACTAAARECDSDVIVNGKVFGDSKESVFKESGDFLIPLNEGRITENHFRGTIGQVISGAISGRSSRDELTVFDALGIAGEDIASAASLYLKKKQ